MKNKLVILLIITFIGVDIFLLIKTIQYKDIITSFHDSNQIIYNSIADLKNETIYRNSLRLRFKKDISVINHDYSDTLISLIGNKPKLFFLFGSDACDACINDAIVDIKELTKRIDSDNIIVLSMYKNTEDVNILMNEVLPIRLLNMETINSQDIGESLEYLPPSFFIMDYDLLPKDYFVYSTLIPQLNESYLNFIENYINEL